jgi:hypothetical protein
MSISQLTSGLDDAQGPFFSTMYGVHGIDANPKFDPTADRSTLCRACSASNDCGGDGNRCTQLSASESACTYGCTADVGCPDGFSCNAILSEGSIKTHQCVPRSLSCR